MQDFCGVDEETCSRTFFVTPLKVDVIGDVSLAFGLTRTHTNRLPQEVGRWHLSMKMGIRYAMQIMHNAINIRTSNVRLRLCEDPRPACSRVVRLWCQTCLCVNCLRQVCSQQSHAFGVATKHFAIVFDCDRLAIIIDLPLAVILQQLRRHRCQKSVQHILVLSVTHTP